MKQPRLFISSKVYNFRPIVFRISKEENSVFAFEFKETDKKPITVYVTQELRKRLIQEVKESDFIGVKIDKIDKQFAKNSFKLRDFKIYRSVSN